MFSASDLDDVTDRRAIPLNPVERERNSVGSIISGTKIKKHQLARRYPIEAKGAVRADFGTIAWQIPGIRSPRITFSDKTDGQPRLLQFRLDSRISNASRYHD